MTTRILPLDIISEILSRLPVKSLIRFKCVSKPWKSLIISPDFTKLHLKNTLISDNHCPSLIFASFSLSFATIDTTDISFLRFTELHHPLLHFPDCLAIKILGSCNGVVCIAPFDKTYACLYNPSTKTHRLLPPTPSGFPQPDRKTMFMNCHHRNHEKYEFVYGFGYDSNSDDYKLLRMLEYYKNSVFVGRECCLYSLRNDSWKYVSDNDVNRGLWSCECTLVNGVLYFIIDSNGKRKALIKTFDLQTEIFSVLDLPKFDEKFDMFHFDLRELDGRLCMLLNSQKNSRVARTGCRLVRADMWIMKDSWVKLFSISDPESIGASMNIKPLVYSKDGRRILVELDGWSFGWYDWENNNFVRVSAYGLPPDNATFDTWTFVESLVSVEKPKAITEGKTIPKKKKKTDVDGFLSSGFKLKL